MRQGLPIILTIILAATFVGCEEKTAPAGDAATTTDAVETGDKASPAADGDAATLDATDDAITDETKEVYLGAAEKTLSGWGAKLDSLYASAKDKGAGLSDKSKAMLEAASEKKDAAMAKLDELKAKSGDAWKDAKPHLDEAMKDLEAAAKAAAANFTDDEADVPADDDAADQ